MCPVVLPSSSSTHHHRLQMDDQKNKNPKDSADPSSADAQTETDGKKNEAKTENNVDVLEVIQRQKSTHDLYCPNCTHNITGTAKYLKREEETFPYKKEKFILWFVIVFSFKYPFIYLPWLYNHTPASSRRNSDGSASTQSPVGKNPKKHVPIDWRRFLLVAVLLLIPAIVLWVPPSPPPLSPLKTPPLSPLKTPPPSPLSSGSSTILVPDSQKTTKYVTETIERLKPLVDAPEDDTETIERLKPIVPDAVEDDRPMTPSPSSTKSEGGWIPLSWVTYLPSNRVLSVISLLLLAILALCWPPISWPKRKKPKNDVSKVDASSGDVQDSTDKPGPSILNTLFPSFSSIFPAKIPKPKSDVPKVDVSTGDAQDSTDESEKVNRPSSPGKKTNGSGKETVNFLAELGEMLRKHIVVPVQTVSLTDILKSIVYGGLIESITSFGVVSSTAASGTSALNVLALGLANLFSGLFLIIYNLYGLIMSQPFYPSANIVSVAHVQTKDMAEVKRIDPYEELLGNRDHRILHCVVVVVSFIFFGVIPLLFYGLSFKTTNNGRYEVAVVVAASLFCVISLSFGKAHAFDQNKLKTVAVYTGIAIGASALSFIAAQHVRALFGKYDFFDKLASDSPRG